MTPSALRRATTALLRNPSSSALKAPPLGDVMQLVLLRLGNSGRYARQVEGELTVDGGERVPLSMLVYSGGKPKHRVLRMTIPLGNFQAIRSASTIHVKAKGELDEHLALSQLDSVMKVMDECVADLRRVWNVREDEDAPSPLSKPAEGSLAGLFRAEDYPQVAITENQQGSVRFAVLIDEEGRAADCTVIETSGAASLDAQGCAIIQERARFKPAVGPDGKPAKDSAVQRVRWVLR